MNDVATSQASCLSWAVVGFENLNMVVSPLLLILNLSCNTSIHVCKYLLKCSRDVEVVCYQIVVEDKEVVKGKPGKEP